MSTLKTLEKLRARITSLQSEIRELKSQPLCQAEAEQRVSAMVEVLGQQFDSGWLGQQIAGPGHIDLRDDAIFQTAAAGSPDKVAAMLAAVWPDALRSFLLDATLPYATGQMTEAERTAQLARLEGELHSIEVAEESEVTRLELAGVEAFRRQDADPSVVLGIA